jgi:hypothetical protein
VGVARQTVYTWKGSLDEGGIDALRAVPGRGRPARLDEEQLAQLRQALLQSPTECDTCRRPSPVKRHEVERTAKLAFALSHFNRRMKAVEAATCCATNSCLPGHARWVTIGYEAPGTMYSSEEGPSW